MNFIIDIYACTLIENERFKFHKYQTLTQYKMVSIIYNFNVL